MTEIKQQLKQQIKKIISGSAHASDYFHPKSGKLIGNFTFTKYMPKKKDPHGVRYNCYWTYKKNKIRCPKVTKDDIILKYKITKIWNPDDPQTIAKTCNFAFETTKNDPTVKLIKEYESGFLKTFGTELLTKANKFKKYKEDLWTNLSNATQLKKDKDKYKTFISTKNSGKLVRFKHHPTLIDDHCKQYPHNFSEKVNNALKFKTLCSAAWPKPNNMEEEDEDEESEENDNCIISKIRIGFDKITNKITMFEDKFYGIKLINHDKKYEMKIELQKLRKYQSKTNAKQEKIDMYKSRYDKAKTEFKKTDSIVWTFDSINKYIPISTKIKRLSFSFTSAYVNPQTVSCQCNAVSIHYTEETTQNETNDNDLYDEYDESDESDLGEEDKTISEPDTEDAD